MKDVSSPSESRRLIIYPKSRPSLADGSETSRPVLCLPGRRLRRRRPVNILGIPKEEEYGNEIQDHMHNMERLTMPSVEAMDQQPQIRWHMRRPLVEFLLDLQHTRYELFESLYLAVNMVDRYVSRRIVPVELYQLVACAALRIAAKFEDPKEKVPTVAVLCCGTYQNLLFAKMEDHILSTLEWRLGHPTAETWLCFICRGVSTDDKGLRDIARFLMEMTLFHLNFLHYTPSDIALGAVALASSLCDWSGWSGEQNTQSSLVFDRLDAQLSQPSKDLPPTLLTKYAEASGLVLRQYSKRLSSPSIRPPNEAQRPPLVMISLAIEKRGPFTEPLVSVSHEVALVPTSSAILDDPTNKENVPI
ncbi:cyclin-like protein [Mycena galericulata]|nr:cyclin-like protein [Mycena galericulata]